MIRTICLHENKNNVAVVSKINTKPFRLNNNITFQKSLTNDVFKKSTPLEQNPNTPKLFSLLNLKTLVNFTGTQDDDLLSIQPENIASPEERQQLKNAFIELLETDNFQEGAIVNALKEGSLTKKEILEIAISQAGRIPQEDLSFLVKNRIPLTAIDNDEILDARLYNLITPPLDVNSNSYLLQICKIIKNEFAKMDKIQQCKKMVIVTGLPASGKSTLLLMYRPGYYLADSDELKAQFVEYEGGKGAAVVHEASTKLLENCIMPEATKRGIKIAVPKVGKPKSIERLAKSAHDAGYQVEIIHVNIKQEESVKRTYNRFLDGVRKSGQGRLVDPYIVNSFNNTSTVKMDDLPEYFAKLPYVDSVQIYDNNGKSPVFVKTVKKPADNRDRIA